MDKPLLKGTRTTVTLADVVWDMAQVRMQERGFNGNFSSYVADLIRRDMERSKNKTKETKP